jgi:hypothetical protein
MDLKAHPRNLGTTKSFSLERAICFSAKSGTHAGIPNLGNIVVAPVQLYGRPV